MADTIEQLRKATDEELIAEHDAKAQHTVVGTAHYQDELRRRETLRSMAASHRLAMASLVLAAVNTVVAAVAVVIAVYG